MSDTLIDILLYLLLIGIPTSAAVALAYGVFHMSRRIRTINRLKRRRENFNAIRLYRMTAKQVPGELGMDEYGRALRYTMHKYPAACKYDPAYTALLITEAVGQDRLSRGTLEIAMNDRELEHPGKQEGNETA